MDRGIRSLLHREIVILGLLLGITVVMFALTRRLAESNDALRRQDAFALYSRGNDALQKADLAAAVASFRRAAVKDPDNAVYRRALAEALMASHDNDAALQLLLDLHEEQPDNADTDLQLARLETRRGDRTAAGRYYQTAIVALWQVPQRAARQEVLAEFVRFLLEHGERDRALSELLVLEAGLPDDVPSHVSAGTMLMQAGDAHRALDHFERALRMAPADPAALAGAVESSFEIADYVRAQRYLKAIGDETDRLRNIRALTDTVLGGDPLAPRLSIVERRQRVAAALSRVVTRLGACASRAPAERLDAAVDLTAMLAEAQALSATMGSRDEPRAFEDIESAFDVAYRGARAADRACGSPETYDRALVLIGLRHGLEDQ